MKVSRSTSRPRRLGRRSSTAPFVIVSVLAMVGAAVFFGNRFGLWGSGTTPTTSPASRAGAPNATPSKIAELDRTPDAPKDAPATAKITTPVGDSVGPHHPITAPRFGREFEEAITRWAFKEAAAAIARAGGAADAERKLANAMEAARERITARYDEIAATAGLRAANAYVAHQLDGFPENAPARRAIEALLNASASAPTQTHVAASPEPQPAAPSAVSERAAPQTDLTAMRDEAARILDTGEVKTALSVLREVATAAEVRNDRRTLLDAQRIIRQGEAELRLRGSIVARVAEGAPDRPVPHLPGERGRILGATEEGVTLASTQGQVALKWRVLPVHALAAIIQVLDLPAQNQVDAAAVLYRAGHGPDADALLARAATAAPDLKQAIDQTLADARGMAVPAAGFRLVDDKWMSPQEFARHDTARQIEQSTKALASPDAAARRAAFLNMVKLGDAAKSPLNRALLMRRADIRDEIQKAPIHAKLADLGAKRVELDEARAHALELIEDEVKYPYPYRPPEATPHAYKLYSESQREIDVRVAKLRGLWNQQISVTVPKAFREKVALLAEVGAFLAEIGASPPEADPGYLAFLPAQDEVTLQTVATSESDRKRIDESAEAMKINATRQTKATRGELDQARITNEYRIMFGRAAVLVHDQLTVAAHGHCEDMARLGFFAHDSPVPGKTTPYDRIRATGMKPLGASENIAQASGPSGAHDGWCHSSGHHRNLLAAGWKLVGVGNSGHLWCQNFSAGEEKPLEEEGGEPR